ncbi:hypothetical protein KR215_009627 [Drosophila sulfurigaster]|nr:hypothetical protein KR215_009627 [Drosophila sulfurigaster]
MGLTNSHQLSAAELQAHQAATGLSIEQLDQLHARFLALDRCQRGYLTPTELLRIPQLAQNPLHRQIIDGFFGHTNTGMGTGTGTGTRSDSDSNSDTDAMSRDRINFGQFVRTCATFLVPQCDHPPHQRLDGRVHKLRLLSHMFDTQRRGRIERTDFRKVMTTLLNTLPPPSDGVANVHPHSSESELQLLEELAFGERESSTYEEFEERLATVDVESKLAVSKWLEEEEKEEEEEEENEGKRT